MTPGLDEPLAERLGLSHHVPRVHRLVRGDEDEPLGSELDRDVRDDAGDERVVPDGLGGIRLDERDVLVRGRVKHDCGPVLLEDLPHLRAVARVRQYRSGRMEAPLVHELAFDLEQPLLPVVDEDEPGRPDPRDLAAELGADRSSRARDQHDLSGQIPGDGVDVDLDGLAPEQVLDLHRADLAREVEVGRDHREEPGERLHRHALGACDLDDPLARLARGGRDRDQELVGPAIAEEVPELVGRPQHADPVQAQVLLPRIVVDEADRRVAERRRTQHLAEDLLGRISGPDDDDFLASRDHGADRGPLDQRAGKEPRAGDEGQQEQEVDDPDPARNPRGMEVEQREDEERGDRGRSHASGGAPDVTRRDVPPPAVVEAGGDEDRDRDRDDEQHDVPIQVAAVVDRRLLIEPEVPRQEPGGYDERCVHADLPQPVPVDRRSHDAGTRAAARTVSTTRSCCAAVIPAQSGTEKFSFAACSVSGRSPSE